MVYSGQNCFAAAAVTVEVSIEDTEAFGGIEGIEESTVLVEVEVDETGSQDGDSSIQESMT